MANPEVFEWVADMFRGNSKQIDFVNSAGYSRNGAVRTGTVKPHAVFHLGDSVVLGQKSKDEQIRLLNLW